MPSRGAQNQLLPQDRGVGEGKRILIFNLAAPSSPALELRVNPKSISTSYNKKITTYQTRGAWVEEHWPVDELTEISGQADTLSFSDWLPLAATLKTDELYQLAFSALVSDTTISSGWRLVAGPFRHGTPMGQNLHNLLQMFLNAGAVYDELGIVNFHRGLMMAYDGDVFFGYFTNFSLVEDADRPYHMSYNFNYRITFSINEISER